MDYEFAEFGREGEEPLRVCSKYYVGEVVKTFQTPHHAFATLINKINGKGTCDSNPYVFVYDFELVK